MMLCGSLSLRTGEYIVSYREHKLGGGGLEVAHHAGAAPHRRSCLRKSTFQQSRVIAALIARIFENDSGFTVCRSFQVYEDAHLRGYW